MATCFACCCEAMEMGGSPSMHDSGIFFLSHRTSGSLTCVFVEGDGRDRGLFYGALSHGGVTKAPLLSLAPTPTHPCAATLLPRFAWKWKCKIEPEQYLNKENIYLSKKKPYARKHFRMTHYKQQISMYFTGTLCDRPAKRSVHLQGFWESIHNL